MSWWVWIVIVIIVLVVIGAFNQEKDAKQPGSKRKSSSQKNLHTSNVQLYQSPHSIAAEVTTSAQLRALERKLETAEKKLSGDSATSNNYDSLCERHNFLQEALDIARNKVFGWQFIPDFDLQTPLNILNNAYKVFTPEEYKLRFPELGGNHNEWYQLRGDYEPDEKDPELPFPIKLRKIVEDAELSIDEKSKKINSLASRNKSDAEAYFELDGKLKPIEQWFEENP